jgi:predicted DNA-binding transcriptional regulator YafY
MTQKKEFYMRNEKYFHAKRIVFLFKTFLSGKQLTTAELQEEIRNEELGDVKIRTLQRDLQLLEEMDTRITKRREGRSYLWYIPRHSLQTNSFFFKDNQLLSLYILKSHLKNLKNTIVSKELETLLMTLEEKYPSQVIANKDLYWDKNIGNYDYSKHNKTIDKIIDSIVNHEWVKIEYDPSETGKVKIYTGKIARIFSYDGYLYIAVYVPDYGYYIAMSIHRILSINKISPIETEVPEFDEEEFLNIRFGVFWGEPKKVKLRIEIDFAKYFINRYWHSSQVITENDDGSLELCLSVPVSHELISWILSWHQAITVIEPDELIEKIRVSLELSLRKYDK